MLGRMNKRLLFLYLLSFNLCVCGGGGGEFFVAIVVGSGWLIGWLFGCIIYFFTFNGSVYV